MQCAASCKLCVTMSPRCQLPCHGQASVASRDVQFSVTVRQNSFPFYWIDQPVDLLMVLPCLCVRVAGTAIGCDDLRGGTPALFAGQLAEGTRRDKEVDSPGRTHIARCLRGNTGGRGRAWCAPSSTNRGRVDRDPRVKGVCLKNVGFLSLQGRCLTWSATGGVLGEHDPPLLIPSAMVDLYC